MRSIQSRADLYLCSLDGDFEWDKGSDVLRRSELHEYSFCVY